MAQQRAAYRYHRRRFLGFKYILLSRLPVDKSELPSFSLPRSRAFDIMFDVSLTLASSVQAAMNMISTVAVATTPRRSVNKPRSKLIRPRNMTPAPDPAQNRRWAARPPLPRHTHPMRFVTKLQICRHENEDALLDQQICRNGDNGVCTASGPGPRPAYRSENCPQSTRIVVVMCNRPLVFIYNQWPNGLSSPYPQSWFTNST